MQRLKIGKGATHPPVELRTEVYASGSGIFAGADVRFRMSTMPGAAVDLEQAATILDVDGVLGYQWVDGDTVAPGRYYAEFKVTYSDGTARVFPKEGFVRIDIVEQGMGRLRFGSWFSH